VTRLIRAEALKLFTTRTVSMIVLGAFVIMAIAAGALVGAGTFGPTDQPLADALAIASLAQTFAVVIGVLVVTGEFRYGTITAALLITPRRLPLLTAKVITCFVAGLAFGLIGFGGVTAIAVPILHMRGIAVHTSGSHIAAMIIGGSIATALAAALGVGIGAVVRNQAGAIVATLAVLYAIEPLLTILPGVGNAISTYGVAGLSSAASGTPALRASAHLLGPVPANLLLALYAALFLAVGAVFLRRRDVTE
jgi:ABC-2 type transport system permease protein